MDFRETGTGALDASGFPLKAGDAVLLDEERTGHAAGVVSQAGSPSCTVAVADRGAWTRPFGIEVDAGGAYLASKHLDAALGASLAARLAHARSLFALAGELMYAGDAGAARGVLEGMRADAEELARDLQAAACAAEVALARDAGAR